MCGRVTALPIGYIGHAADEALSAPLKLQPSPYSNTLRGVSPVPQQGPLTAMKFAAYTPRYVDSEEVEHTAIWPQ